MTGMNRRMMLGLGLASAAGLTPVALRAQPPKTAAPGQPLNITVTTAAPPPKVSLVLGSRSGRVLPQRSGCNHTGGGNIDVQQPSPDTFVVTMSGVAVAYGGPFGGASAAQMFDLAQQFDVSFDDPNVKAAKLSIEGRVIGFLRSHKIGSAEECAGATISGPAAGLALSMPSHAVAGCESLGINDYETPPGVVIGAPGKFCLNQNFRVSATMPRCGGACKAPSAEFAPDPALDPIWISYKEPFHGAAKKDLGFQVIVRVVPDEVPAGK